MYTQANKSKENSFSTNRQESRAVANSVAQKKSDGKQGLEFVDNRPEAIAQRILQETMDYSTKIENTTLQYPSKFGDSDVTQCMFTLPRSVALDMHHPEWKTLFKNIEDFKYLWSGDRAKWTTQGRIAAIVKHINGGYKTFSYNQLSTDTLSNAADISTLSDSTDERMYVHNGTTIHTATRAEGTKKPHPTLVGGNPDVTCAGTLNINKTIDGVNTTYTVGVTNESGHFRPDDVPDDTVNRINTLANNSLPENTTITTNKKVR